MLPNIFARLRILLLRGALRPALPLAALVLLAGCAPAPRVVTPHTETAPMPHAGDSADDPAIWLNPHDPARSTIIGTDKLGGLAVYDLAGAQLQYLADGLFNNVDLRASVPLDGVDVALVAAGDRASNQVVFYRVEPATRLLAAVPGRVAAGIEIYGLCMYRSPASGALFVVVNSKSGAVEQWELTAQGGALAGRLVRAFEVGSQTEGCVADDAAGQLYIGEEQVGIWRYGAEPDAGAARVQVDHTGWLGHLASNVEGLALADGPNGGFLIASSQGNSRFVVYARGGENAYLHSFTLGAGGGIDAVSDTDGIAALAANLGPQFPHGLFVAQDGTNDTGNQNFKLVRLEEVVGAGQ